MDDGSGHKVMFREVQRFRQWWMWLILLSVNLGIGGVLVYGLYQQLHLGKPFGNNAVSDTALIWINVPMLAMLAAFTWLMWTMRLITEVRAAGIYVRLAPFWGRTIAYRDIESCEARRYSPIREYGGWGIRYSGKGKAYNAYGSEGVQLSIKGEPATLIGSQKAEALADAINKIRKG